MPDRDVLAKLARLARDPGATDGEKEAARAAHARISARLGVVPRTLSGAKPATLAEHGTSIRAQICTDDCSGCGPVREASRARQRERYAARRSDRANARG